MENLTPLITYMLITTFTPGPNNISSMANASRYGFRGSLRYNIGIFFGFFSVISLCSVFSLSLYNLIPAIKPVITVIGAAYILWLAYKTWASSAHLDGNDNGTNTFLAGFLLQFINPKVILYGITTVSTFVLPYYQSFEVLAFFSFILAAVGFIATSCWSLFGSLFQKMLSENSKGVNLVMSLLLVYCAVSLFL